MERQGARRKLALLKSYFLTDNMLQPSTDLDYLVCFARTSNSCAAVPKNTDHLQRTAISSSEIKNLDRWDVLGGTSFTRGPDGGESLHVAFHSSLRGSNLHTMAWPVTHNSALTDEVPATDAKWMQHVKYHREEFSEEFKLYDHVLVRTYGMASHVAGNTVATSISVHPSDMIQYAISVEQSSHLLISDELDDLPPLKGS